MLLIISYDIQSYLRQNQSICFWDYSKEIDRHEKLNEFFFVNNFQIKKN